MVDDSKEIPITAMERIFDRIDRHLEKYSAGKSSSRNALPKKNKEKSLILPSLSKRPADYQVIQSVDIKHSKRKDKSFNRIKKIPSTQNSQNIKVTSVRGSPVAKKTVKKIENFNFDIPHYKNSINITLKDPETRENSIQSVSLLNSNKNRLKDHLRKLVKVGKKKSIGIH